MMMLIENKYNLGDFVYLITDEDRVRRIVTALNIRPGYVSYELTQGINVTYHTEIEIIKEEEYIGE